MLQQLYRHNYRKVYIKNLTLGLILALFVGVTPVLAQGSISLSQTNVSLNVGQSTTISVYPPSGQIVNVTSILNTYVAFANVSNNVVTVYGLAEGTSQIQLGTFDNSTATIYVTVGNGNGNYNYNGNSGAVSFSQNNVSLNVGQSTAVSIFNNINSNFNTYYISSNSNSSAVNASISGNSINLIGMNPGSSTITVYSNQNINNPGTLYVTVGGYNNNNGSLSLSQSNVSLTIGQSALVTATNNSGSLYISSNSQSYIASVIIINNQLSITGNSIGSTSIVVNSANGQSATIFVTVGGNNNYGNISFSQNNVSLNAGQFSSVSIFNNNNNSNFNTYYISSNSNSNVVTASISGNTISLSAINPGSSAITVYSNQNTVNFGTLYVTVGGTNYNGSLSFSQNNVNVNVGQSAIVTIYNNNSRSLYVSSNSPSYIAQATINSNLLTITGNSIGSTSIVVNSANGQSGTIFVTVGGNNYNNGNISFSPSTVSLNVGQSTAVSIYNNFNSNFNTYYISSNSNSNVVSASISGNTINLYAINSGSTTITVYSSQNSSNIGTLYVTVGGYNNNNSGSVYFSSITPTQATLGQYYNYSLQVYGGSSPYSYSLYSGTMPPGLTLGTNGTIIGTPTTPGNYSFAVRVSDYIGRSLISGTIYLNVVNSSNFSGNVAGISIYANGTLINDNGTIYIIYKNTKTGFGNLAAFQGLGFKLGNVIAVSDPSLVNSGFIIGSASTAHPWGSWIKNGTTVYFVHDQGLIPISSHDVFINNGGRDNMVVAANLNDLAKPILGLMSLSDPRLR